MLGKIYLNLIDISKAQEYFSKAGNIEYCAYCYFLMGNLEEAFIHLQLIKKHSPFSNWLQSIICLIQKLPLLSSLSYFQIRNFYEQDLEMLFKNNQYEIINKILQLNYYIENYNKEIYKYSARVLFNNKQNELALELIEKSIDICYKDPETHFIKGEILLIQGFKDMAIESFKKADKVSGNYMPAKARLKDLSQPIE